MRDHDGGAPGQGLGERGLHGSLGETCDGCEQALADAENSKASYEQKEKDFDEEIRAEKSRLSKEIEAERERRLTAARGEAEKIISDARGEAEREKNEIIESAQKEITGMVTDAMEKLTLEQTASDAFDQFLDAAEEADKRVKKK